MLFLYYEKNKTKKKENIYNTFERLVVIELFGSISTLTSCRCWDGTSEWSLIWFSFSFGGHTGEFLDITKSNSMKLPEAEKKHKCAYDCVVKTKYFVFSKKNYVS